MRTKNELIHIITTRGIATQKELEEMPLSASYLRSCPTEIYEWLMQARGSDVEKALSEPTEAQKREADAARFFGKATAEESQAVLEVAAEFCRKHPEFAQTQHNAGEVINWLKDRLRAKPTLKDFEDAYHDLKFRNALEINEPEPVVSASQWLKEHSELREPANHRGGFAKSRPRSTPFSLGQSTGAIRNRRSYLSMRCISRDSLCLRNCLTHSSSSSCPRGKSNEILVQSHKLV